MKSSKKRKLKQMEYEDSVGIKRTKNKNSIFTLKTLAIARIVLIAAIPVVYFLYSPLLAIIIIAWALLIIATIKTEKRFNAGLKGDMCTKLPKTDCVLCIVLLAIVLICVIVSSFSGGTKAGFFDGMTDSEISENLDKKFDYSEMVWRQILSKIKDFGSLMTGTRRLFRSEMGFGGGGGGTPPDDNFTPPSGGAPDISGLLSDMPFSMVFSSVMKAVCTAMLVVVCIIGILAIFRLKKIKTFDMSAAELARAKKKQEEKQKKKEAKKKYFSIQKADFAKIEREVLDDLDFLFDDGDSAENTEENTANTKG